MMLRWLRKIFPLAVELDGGSWHGTVGWLFAEAAASVV
jgi:hypothetical protein